VFTAAPCSFLCPDFPPDADSFSFSRGDGYGSPRTRTTSGIGAPAASQGATSPSPLLLSSPNPLLFFSHGGEHRKGKTPSEPWLALGLGLWVVGARSKRRRGKERRTWLPLAGFPGAATASGGRLHFSVTGRGRWGNLPLVEPLDRVTSAHVALSVRASSAARPSHPSARSHGACRSARCGARLRGKGEDEEGRETDERVPLASEREEKERGHRRCAVLGCNAG
jgi:hypothetical protein